MCSSSGKFLFSINDYVIFISESKVSWWKLPGFLGSKVGAGVWPFVNDRRGGWRHGRTCSFGWGRQWRRRRLRGILSFVLWGAVQRQVDHLHLLAVAAVAATVARWRGAPVLRARRCLTRVCAETLIMIFMTKTTWLRYERDKMRTSLVKYCYYGDSLLSATVNDGLWNRNWQ